MAGLRKKKRRKGAFKEFHDRWLFSSLQEEITD
jgi:hypothetical protein